MAQVKKSLDYYSHPIGMTADRRLIPARRRYGSAAVDVLFSVLDMIYSGTGYYMTYDDSNRDEVLWDIAGRIRGKDSPDEEGVAEIIELLVTGGIFDKDLFGRGIITSKQVQEQFYLSTLKRKVVTVEREYWLLSVEYLETLKEKSPLLDFLKDNVGIIEENVGIIDENVDGNSQSKVKESKEKKSKENKSKVKESKAEAAAPAAQEPLPDPRSHLTNGEEFSFSDNDDPKRLTDEQIKQLIISRHGEQTLHSYEQRFSDWSRARNITDVRMYPVIYRWITKDIPQKTPPADSNCSINVDDIMADIMAKYIN